MGYVEKKVLQHDELILKRFKLHPLKLVFAWISGVLGYWLIYIPTIKQLN